MRLDGKVALVTGAGSGIGAAAARLFAEEGAAVVCVDLDERAAAATAAGVGGVGVAGSVADPELWDRATAAAAGLGGLDVAYLNAGVYGHSLPIDELALDVYARVIDANVSGVVLGTRAVVPLLRARGGGAIVASASLAGIIAFDGNPVYTMSKHAVTGFVQAVAPSLQRDRITINAVCPGVVDTPMTAGAADLADVKAMGIPLIDAHDIAVTALDLATSDATGTCRWVLPGMPSRDWHSPDAARLLAT